MKTEKRTATTEQPFKVWYFMRREKRESYKLKFAQSYEEALAKVQQGFPSCLLAQVEFFSREKCEQMNRPII